ncbi:orotate phosphoribosyltransferase [Patescibacteria group bacterium]
MQHWKREFIDFALNNVGALKFGEFTLKSGRISPYFFNAGLFNTGASLRKLATAYTNTIFESCCPVEIMYGPAYKGIPLVASISVEMIHMSNNLTNMAWCFNRKEAKDHGEGGVIVGSKVTGRKVLIIDDVISAGTSVRESVGIITKEGGEPTGVCIALDRQERGLESEFSAVQEVEREFDLPVTSIITMSDLVEYLQNEPGMEDDLANILIYREQYGVN